MNNVYVNFDNLTERDKEQLNAIIARSQEKSDDFNIEIGEEYYFIDTNGDVNSCIWENDYVDDELKAFGNCSKNYSYVEMRAEEIKLYNLLQNYAWNLYDGEAFTNREKYSCSIDKWCLLFIDDDLCVPSCQTIGSNINVVYFKTKEDCQKAIDEVFAPWWNDDL